jgi:membrane protein YdbS with pleckstrin-like domain
VIYEALRGGLLRLLRAPEEPPEPPAGSPGSVQVFRASPKFLGLRVAALLLATLPVVLLEILPLAAVAAAGEDEVAMALAGVVAVLTLLAVAMRWFLIRLDWDMRHYVVTDRSLRIRQGALVILESTFTFANVQNLTIEQGPLERLFGLANLRIETAGGGGAATANQPGGVQHRGVLAGIENAEEVRDRILALLRAYRGAGLGDRDEPATRAGLPLLGIERLREILAELRALRAAIG